jgi:hypothetical protein
MSEFTGKMVLGEWYDIELRKDKLWVIISPLIWVRPNGYVINMSPYLITDYASIPKIFWPIIPKRDETYDLAAAFHDDCMRNRKRRNMSKKDCHDVFKEIMKHFNTDKWKYEVMYFAVNVGGVFVGGKGDGQLPWELTEEEKKKYDRIKKENPWTDYNLIRNNDFYVDEFNIF